MELFPFLIFAILNLSGAYLWKYKSESNETTHWEAAIRDSAECKNFNFVLLLSYFPS